MMSKGSGKTHWAAYGPRQAQSLSISDVARSTESDQYLLRYVALTEGRNELADIPGHNNETGEVSSQSYRTQLDCICSSQRL
jgi:hypothetical protein